MTDPASLFLSLPAVSGKKVTAAFDGRRLTSKAGVLLLREVERTLGIAERLAGCLTDRRDPSRIGHTVAEISCPTRYFDDASSIGFGRSVKYGFGCLATSAEFLLARFGWRRSARFPKLPATAKADPDD